MHHKKVYESPVEEGYRMKIFLDNKRKIAEHNRKYEMEEVSYKLGMNKYGDMVILRSKLSVLKNEQFFTKRIFLL